MIQSEWPGAVEQGWRQQAAITKAPGAVFPRASLSSSSGLALQRRCASSRFRAALSTPPAAPFTATTTTLTPWRRPAVLNSAPPPTRSPPLPESQKNILTRGLWQRERGFQEADTSQARVLGPCAQRQATRQRVVPTDRHSFIACQ